MQAIGSKVCVGCHSEKALTEFTFRTQRGKRYPLSWCRPCWAEKQKNNRNSDIEANRKYKREFYKKNISRCRAIARNSRLKRPEKIKALLKKWRQENYDHVQSYAAARRAKLLLAMPEWADVDEIKEIYKRAAGTGMHVDHIVPLVSKMVCGLHVPANLQIIGKRENLSKGNRFWPDMP